MNLHGLPLRHAARVGDLGIAAKVGPDATVRRIAPWVQRGERLLRPRLVWLAQPPMQYAISAVCLLLAVALALPIPLGNVLPALAIVERDGLWVLTGLGAARVSAGVVSGVVFAGVKLALLLFERLLQ